MYSLRWTFRRVRRRLTDNAGNLLPSEAFVLTMFLVEKVIRRVLLQLIISAGYPTNKAKDILDNMRGLGELKEKWALYDPRFRRLTEILPPQTWEVITRSATLRNGLIHGAEHKKQKVYRVQAEQLLDALDTTRHTFQATYGYQGWKGLKVRATSALHEDPKVDV